MQTEVQSCPGKAFHLEETRLAEAGPEVGLRTSDYQNAKGGGGYARHGLRLQRLEGLPSLSFHNDCVSDQYEV